MCLPGALCLSLITGVIYLGWIAEASRLVRSNDTWPTITVLVMWFWNQEYHDSTRIYTMPLMHALFLFETAVFVNDCICIIWNHRVFVFIYASNKRYSRRNLLQWYINICIYITVSTTGKSVASSVRRWNDWEPFSIYSDMFNIPHNT